MKEAILKCIISYLILMTYFNVIPFLIEMNDIVRFLHLLLFFPIAFMVSKLFTRKGLESYGLVFFQGWKRNLFLGFGIGLISWSILFLLYILFWKYDYIGIQSPTNIMTTLVVIIVGYGLGSIINDMITRGLVFYYFKDKLPILYVMVISIILYVIDDIWYGGMSVQNTIFSIALGISLTYAFYKTNSIWANTGIHFGLNVVYGLFFGVSGNAGDGVFIVEETTYQPFFLTWASTFISILMFIILYRLKNFFVKYNAKNSPNNKM